MPALAARRPVALSALERWLFETPGRIALCFAAILLSLLIAAAVGLDAASSTDGVIRTLGTDAEPSVVLALRIGATLSDMDAAAAEDALDGGFSASGASRRWRDDKTALDALVVQSSRNITYPDETVALQNLLLWVGEYHASLAEVRGAADPARPFIATQRLQWSHRLLTEFVQPEADALAAANRTPLEAAYRRYNDVAAGLGIGSVWSAALVLVALVAVQVFLWRRTHRMFNLPLVLAAAVALGLGGALLTAMLREREAIRSAKADSYDSLDPLFAAKSLTAAMNADLSYWLLDPATRPAESAELDKHARALLDMRSTNPSALPRPQEAARLRASLDAAQALEQQGRDAAARSALPEMGGLLGKELGNITFGVAERGGASDAVRSLLDFERAADRVRSLGASNQELQAVQVRNTEGAAALAALQAALDRTIAVNQAEFDRRIGEAQRLVGWTPAVLCGGLALIGLLAAAGLWPRYREYM